jgi:ubiquinone/menaquinone biosynthesis C-methylase UbiE
MPENDFVGDIARTYDERTTAMSAPELLATTAGCLHDLADGGPLLEFAIGTGRVALPLTALGADVTGVELSADMISQLRSKPGGQEIVTVEGDMATCRIDQTFSLVYLV